LLQPDKDLGYKDFILENKVSLTISKYFFYFFRARTHNADIFLHKEFLKVAKK